MNRIEKDTFITSFKDVFGSAKGAVLINFRGLTVEKITAIRKDLRKEGISYRVMKNSLAKKACVGTPSEGLGKFFTGPTAMAYTKGDPVTLAKIVHGFAKTNETFKPTAVYFDGRVFPNTDLEKLATMPSKEVLIAKMLGTLNAPITGLVNVLAGPMRKFVYALSAIKDQKEKSGNPTP